MGQRIVMDGVAKPSHSASRAMTKRLQGAGRVRGWAGGRRWPHQGSPAMPHCFNGGRTQPTTLQRTFQPITPVRAAVCVALYGMWPAAHAQQTPAAQEPAVAALQEVTVTATRRQQTLEAVPYSMSGVRAERLAAHGGARLPPAGPE